MDGGGETSASYLQSFILVLLANPDCQRRAQAEIDAVIGSERFPELKDFHQLPYVQALVKEVCLMSLNVLYLSIMDAIIQIHRFRPLLPIGMPHLSTEDFTVSDGTGFSCGMNLLMLDGC